MGEKTVDVVTCERLTGKPITTLIAEGQATLAKIDDQRAQEILAGTVQLTPSRTATLLSKAEIESLRERAKINDRLAIDMLAKQDKT